MVKITTLKQYNADFTKERHGGLICVFAGATGGIGAATLEKTASMLHASTFYVLGRSEERFASQRDKLRSINPELKVIFIETNVSLLSNIDAASSRITTAEKRLDLLYMSAGTYPLSTPRFTEESLETSAVMAYYSRVRLLSNLLPLLRQSSQPRVLSVLNGGNEKPMHDEDLDLERFWSSQAAINHTTVMTSLAFEHLAAHEQHITFLHNFPGLVQTDIIARVTPPPSLGLIERVKAASFQYLVMVVMALFGSSVEDSGDRQAFHLTSEQYSKPGAWRIGASSDQISESAVLDQYKDRGRPEKIWDHTLRVFDKALATGTNNG